MTTQKKHALFSAGMIVTSVLLFLLLMAFPLEASFRTESGKALHAWYSKTFSKLFPLILAAVISLSALAWRWTGKALAGPSSGLPRRINALRTLLWLPAVALGGYTAPWIGIIAAGVVMPYGVPLICAWTVERLVGDSVQSDSVRENRRIFTRPLLAYLIFLVVAGLHFQHELGPESGDEPYYLVQVRSLSEDGNLELSDERLAIIAQGEDETLFSSHTKVNADGRRYSNHSFGLPLLAWPLHGFGVFGRQLLLALIGALAVAGCRAICLALQAPRKASSLVVWTLAFSYVWAMYAVRFLPEILGCGLMAWAFWAVVSQKDKRWTSTVVALLCCGFLPYAHIRWAPPSLVLAACFGIEGLFLANEKTSRKLIRLLFFAAGYAAFGFTLLYCHSSMFSGTQAYDYGEVLLSYPLGMWAIFADGRGLFAVLPPLIWYFISVPYCLVAYRGSALRVAEAGLVFAAVLATSCSTTAALYGACVPGRYLLTAVPVLLPASAIMLSRSGKAGRLWFYFLAVMPVLFYGFVGSLLKYSFGSFTLVPEKLRRYIGFQTFWDPLTSFLSPANEDSIIYATLFVMLLMGVTALFVVRKHASLFSAAAIFLLAAATFFGYKAHVLENASKDTNTGLLAKVHDWEYYLPRAKPPKDLFEFFMAEPPVERRPFFTLTDRPVPSEAPANLISIQNTPRNDWAGRTINWYPIRRTPIRHNFDGYTLLRVVGTVKRGTGVFAVRQGAHTLDDGYEIGEGPFDFTWIIETHKGWGFTEALASLKDNQGEVDVDYFQLVPYSPYMTSSGFTFPSSTLVRDLSTTP